MTPVSQFPFKELVDFAAYFPTFNPVQSEVLKYLQLENNLVLSAPTGSGKTEIAEMFMAAAIVKNQRALYLAPFKSINEEKFFGRWSNIKHGFSKLPKIIMTGDYSMTSQRKGYLERAKIIAATSEMLDHRTRHIQTDSNKWLLEIGVLVVDEAHLLTDGDKDGDGRGHKLEAAIMRFAHANPSARIVLLSATMPNVNQLSEWLTTLNGKTTDLLQSDYRPCELKRNFVSYYDGGTWQQKADRQMDACLKVIQQFNEDQFLVFTSNKRWGREFQKRLEFSHLTNDFHNADKRREELNIVEQRFKNKEIQVLVATSTLAAGVNLPARRVIIPHVTYGRNEDVPVYEIQQKEGRAGRLGYDVQGDSYIVLPESNQSYHQVRIQKGEMILSRLTGQISLIFHLLGEIAYGNVKTLADAEDWYRRSLAYHQTKKFPVSPTLQELFDQLQQYKLIFFKNAEYSLTPLGKVCSMFYLHPFDVIAWYRNFDYLFAHQLQEKGSREQDCLISLCLAAIPSKEGVWAQTDKVFAEGPEFMPIHAYKSVVQDMRNNLPITDTGVQVGYLIYCLMNGIFTGDYNYSIIKNIENDHERILQALQTVDQMVAHWGQPGFWRMLNLRLKYKVAERFLNLVMVKGIGGARAVTLYNGGLKNAKDIVNNVEQVMKLFKGPKRYLGIVQAAQDFLNTNHETQVDLPLEFQGVHG